MVHPVLSLILVLLVVGAMSVAVAISVMARALLRPPRMTDGKAAWVLKRLSPGDLGLLFEDVRFDVRDEASGRKLTIAAWWIPHPRAGGRCAVIVHGYADAKVGSIAWAPTWHAMGFNLLVLDLRAHGESGGTMCTGGFFERHDVADVIGQLRAGRPADARQVVLFGASMGAAVAAGAAALREGVADAVVLESPFADYRAAVRTHMDLLGLPGGAMQGAAVWLAQRWSGADFAAVRPVDLLGRIACPVMAIVPADDVFLPPAHERAIDEAVRARGNEADVYWRVADAGHLGALYVNPDDYRDRIAAFVERALSRSENAVGAPVRDRVAPPV